MKILQVKKFPIFDIFTGEGWENWSRYLIKKNKIIYIAGIKLSDKQSVTQLTKTIQNATQS
jgi:hypothetical protein